MKILIFNWQDIKNPLGGGAEVHQHEIFKRLVARGHEVTLFCSSFSGAPSEELIDGIRVIRGGSRNLFNFLVPLRYWSRFKGEPFDVVVDDINKIPFFTPLFVKKPLVGIVHHLFGHTIHLEASLPAAWYVRMSEYLSLKLYRRVPIAVVSESTRQEFLHHGFEKEHLFLVPNCVDQTRYRAHSSSDHLLPVVGHLGRLKKYKNVDHLLEAFEIVLKEIPEAKLVILGEGDARPALERFSRELGIQDAVRFTGQVSEEEKVNLLNEMRLATACSIKEGWGLTVVEANACGVPVVASDVPGLRDSVIDEKTGLLYEYGNIEQLAQKILLLLRDDHLRQRLAAGALEWARSFDWERSADAMEELLERVQTRTR